MCGEVYSITYGGCTPTIANLLTYMEIVHQGHQLSRLRSAKTLGGYPRNAEIRGKILHRE